MFDARGIDDVFRTEWPRLVATLVRDLGDLDLAEECVQDAFVEASRRWEVGRLPDRPGAWLLTTARHRAIDRLRRSQRFDTVRQHLESRGEAARTPHELVDDQLALLLGCCHPALAPEAQVALTLRAVGGLSTAQIAEAFFVSEETMTRRITRAKTKIRGANIPFRVGNRETLRERLPVVLGVVYSIFTEGHTGTTSTSLVRGDLCEEAIWLGSLLADLVPDEPEAHGLLALMLLTDARRAARVTADGEPVLLADQDRSRWDRQAISAGLERLGRAHALGSAGSYQLQAAIAALHVTAPSLDTTNWERIVALYDALLARAPTTVLALNRAVAVSYATTPQAGLDALDAIEREPTLRGDLGRYPYFHSARGELLCRVGRTDDALDAFETALAHSRTPTETQHLRARLDTIRDSHRGT